MLCEKCKIREATIQYTEVINGVKTEHNFCSQCAREMNFGQYSAIFEGDFPLAKLLSGLLGEESAEESSDYKKIVCPTCHTTYDEFINNSRFGCPDCYEVFDLLIGDTIKQLQGSDTHKGKHPKFGTKMIPESLSESLTADNAADKKFAVGKNFKEIKELRQKLDEAVKKEEFEEAAKIRDDIKQLEKGEKSDA